MSISIVTIEEKEKWDGCVKKVSNYDVFYLNRYLKAFQLQGSGEPILVVYENGTDYAVNAVFKRDIAEDKHFINLLNKNTYYDLSTPYGYGGFIGNVSDKKALMEEWNNFCKENGFVSEFVRFELFSDYVSYYDGEAETRTHNVVRSLDMSLDELWMDFKQKVRKNVKRANTFNLEIVVENNESYLDDFLRIYYGTMDRTDAEDEYYFKKEFFQTLNEMSNNVIYFHVMHEGKVISTELVIYGAENCYSYLGGTDREYFDMRPNDFLKYEIIKWAKEKGLKNFVLGGGYGADDGIFQYKRNLAPNGIVDFYIGRKVFDQDVYKKLVEMRGNSINDERFFPLYRA